MNDKLRERSGGRCELSHREEELFVYQVLPENPAYRTGRHPDNEIAICDACLAQIIGKEPMEPEFWRFLPDTMWSEVPAVQAVAWRILNRLKQESWASEALDILYLDEDTLAWAKAVAADEDTGSEAVVHKDSNGNVLQNGDSVVLTKTLDVKGSSLSAKLGTVVKNIRLVEDNPEQIEGRVEGQLIVILTKYLRKQS